MKAFLAGIAAMIVISVAAALAVQNLDYMIDDRGTSDSGSVRLGDGT